METKKLENFARYARRSLMEQVTVRLEQVLAVDSGATREQPGAVKELNNTIKEHNKEQVVERVAYTWFNRFCALRFMDVNRYARIGVVSPASGQFQPEILADAKMGHIDEQLVSAKTREHIIALLNGKAPSHDPQGEAYRLLLVGTCNYWHQAMPFLFERIGDYTELLMPDDLLSGNSILAYAREAMTPDACRDVEVVGWLYQFDIAEKKDEIFAGLKKNIKISAENIPAATQLFTPHWIVRYMVENSLGRLRLLNRPGSRLIERMDYYFEPEQVETDFLRISKPEEIKICDPACGSGHILVYAFDLLYAIYEEEGYDPDGIPEKILTHNLYGIEIDEYLSRVPEPAYAPDAKNVIPILDGDWFVDDIVGRFRDFMRLTFGDEHYEANLRFIEQALGKNGNARDLRDYFLKDFYRDHVKRYKKRPIYWLFSSQGGSFNALIYMQRYRPDTVGVALNDYLREFRAKLTSRKHHLEVVSISASAEQRDKSKALKETEKLNRIIVELEEYEREVLYPLAIKQVEIDLDDGVKVNYPKLGAALKIIPGL